jgi:dienelactone hydrolase
MKRKIGKIIIPGNTSIWPHEEATAKALAAAGYTVKFMRVSERDGENSADAYVDGVKYEFKAPKSGKLSAVEDNLKKAVKQSDRIVFDSRRMKHIPDKAIARELMAQLRKSRRIVAIMFVNRSGEIVDIQ